MEPRNGTGPPADWPGPAQETGSPDRAQRRRITFRELLVRFPVTCGLTAVTLTCFLLESLLGGTTDFYAQFRLGALRADLVFEQGQAFRIICAAFLHHSWIHLGLNWLAFLQLGALTEHVYGSWRLLWIYLLCAVASSLCSAVMMDLVSGGSRGASGAIMGLAGLLLVASWFAHEPTRSLLRGLFGRRLLIGVLLTFGLGVGLLLWLPIIDNWGHLGGFLAGAAVGLALRRPDRPEGAPSIAFAVLLSVLALGSFGWMAGTHQTRGEFHLSQARFARSHPRSMGGTLGAVETYQMLDDYLTAGRPREAREALDEALGRFTEAGSVMTLGGLLHGESVSRSYGLDWDDLALLAMERALELAPNDPGALNLMAWHLLTRPRLELRDDARALKLAERAVAALPEGAADQRAATLDTLALALTRLGRWEEALPHQAEAVRGVRASEGPLLSVLTSLGIADPAPAAEIELRYARILDRLGRRDEALVAARRALALAPEDHPERGAMGVLVDRLSRGEPSPAPR